MNLARVNKVNKAVAQIKVRTIGGRLPLTLFHKGYFLVILAWGGAFFALPNYLLNYKRYDNETW